MLKLNKLFFILVAGLLYGGTVSARVCFLAGTEDEAACLVSTPEFEPTYCVGYSECAIPAKGARVCSEGGNTLYLPEECCSNSNLYERCDGNGEFCDSVYGCVGSDENGTYTACQIGHCACLPSYTETCPAERGLKGVGEPCGGKYASCQCNPGEFFTCDRGATCTGPCDLDSSQCASCTCPAVDNDEWVSDPSSCCAGSDYSCTSKARGKTGTTVYHCKPYSPPENCICGYVSNGGCLTSCTDNNYSYKGTKAHVTCSDYTTYLNDANNICGNNCRCSNGYFDFASTCSAQKPSVCADLGYNATSCSADWIACPFDPNAKKCLADTSCSGYNLSTCPANAECSACPNDNTKFKFVKCNDGYQALTQVTTGKTQCVLEVMPTCPIGSYTTQSACSTTSTGKIRLCTKGADGCWRPTSTGGLTSCLSYRLSSCPANGNCSTCPSDSSKYKLDSCKSGYVKSDNTCLSCSQRQTAITNAIKPTFLQVCSSSSSRCSQSCSGSYAQWDNGCICNLIGTSYCLQTDTSTGTVTAAGCTLAAKERCETAATKMNELITQHNQECPNNKVTGTASFSCDSFISGNSLYLTRCSYLQ